MSKQSFDPKNPDKQHNYELKSDAVDALVNADTEEVPQYSKEELGKYRTHRSIELPELVKVLRCGQTRMRSCWRRTSRLLWRAC